MAMPKWLEGMQAPTLMLWLFAVAFGIVVALGPDGAGIPKQADLASSIALPLVLAGWVLADARKRDRKLCYDYDSLVYFAWPVIVPVYLFQTRGKRALLTLLCFGGICLVAVIAAAVAVVVRGQLTR